MDDDQHSGWLTFAAVILVAAGIMKIFDSIWAFRAKGNLDSSHAAHATLGSSVRAYGWWWLVIGILLILAGFAVLQRSQVARWFGILVAVIAAVGSLAWMPYFPVWALLYALISILVIYALAAHGGLEIPAQLTGGASSGDAPPGSGQGSANE
jgi:hypothetical protein